MHCDKKAIQDLKEIALRDYGVSISDEQADELGVSLLRLTRIAVVALAQASKEVANQRQDEINKI